MAALEKQAAALRARHEIEVHTALCDEPDGPLWVKDALYRIAQEALHNTAKHAHAEGVGLLLKQESEGYCWRFETTVSASIHRDLSRATSG